MPLSEYAYDRFVAQEFSSLSSCLARPVGPDLPDSQWLAAFVLTSIFRASIDPPKAALAFAVLRRAEGAVEEFDAGAEALRQHVTGARTASSYFRCLRKFEGAVAQLYQGLEFVRVASGVPHHAPGDGSSYERLKTIYNNGRHKNPQELPAGHLHWVWLRDDGIHTPGAQALSFEELREMVRELAAAADYISKGGPWAPPQQT